MMTGSNASSPCIRRHRPTRSPPRAGEPLAYDRQLPLACVVSEFARAVRASSKSLDSLDLGVEVVRLLDRCEAALPVA